MADKKTLCNLSDKMCARCDGAGLIYKEQQGKCDGARLKHSHYDYCFHLRRNGRCDSHVAQDIAAEELKK